MTTSCGLKVEEEEEEEGEEEQDEEGDGDATNSPQEVVHPHAL
eukprot:COSAG01_NODE_360_length_18184_cov_21.881780_20_plen_43_part_00